MDAYLKLISVLRHLPQVGEVFQWAWKMSPGKVVLDIHESARRENEVEGARDKKYPGYEILPKFGKNLPDMYTKQPIRIHISPDMYTKQPIRIHISPDMYIKQPIRMRIRNRFIRQDGWTIAVGWGKFEVG